MTAAGDVNITESAPGSTAQHQQALQSPKLSRAAQKTFRFVLRIAVGLVLILATPFFFNRLVPLNAATAGFCYLVAILLIATKGGLVEATIASIAAVLCFNFFFLPPIGTFTISDPQNWIALFAFLATSLTASQLSARARMRALESEERRNEIERLYSLSRALLLIDTSRPIANQIVYQIFTTCGFAGIALYIRSTGELYRAGLEQAEVEDRLRESAVRSAVLKDESSDLMVTPIRLGGEPIGSLALSGGEFSDAALQSLVNLVAIGLERAHAQKAMTQAEVARQSEELKSTMLDALAHEFKTPLTSIKAVTTDLLSAPHSSLQPHQHELITIVDESADRLSKLVSDAIQLARIEGGTFRLNLGTHFPSSLVNAALRQMKSLTDERDIRVDVPEGLPPVCVDAELIQIVLTHLLDNSLKYSPPSSPIHIGARLGDGKVILYLADKGEGIHEEELAKIFEKFYRGRNERHLQGTGMGLPIAREILRAHGEDITLTTNPQQGTEFSFGLPIAPGALSQ
jgi:two-component system sensor histidine kinase KdpD